MFFPPPFPSCVNLTSRQALCLEYEFLEIFSFVNWIIGMPLTAFLQEMAETHRGRYRIVMLYSNTLFTLAVINHMRKQPIWFTPVRDTPRLPPLVFASPGPTLSMDEVKTLLSGSSFSLPQHDSRRPPIINASSVPSLRLHTLQAHQRGDDATSGSGQTPLLPASGQNSLDSHEHRRRSTMTLPPDYSERLGAQPSSP